jgi:hypothetical protein
MPITREQTANRKTKAGIRTAIAIGTDARVRQSLTNQETVAGHAGITVGVS